MSKEMCEEEALKAMKPLNLIPYLEEGKLKLYRVRVSIHINNAKNSSEH